MDFYVVLNGLAEAFISLAWLIWTRIYNFPIEHLISMSTNQLIESVKNLKK